MDEHISTNDKVVEKTLMEKNLNIATVHPLSKLPVPGGSGLKPTSSISQTCKRKNTQLEEQVAKRAKLEVSVMLEPTNNSFMSTASVKFSAKATGNLPSDSYRTTKTRNLANMRPLNVQKGKGKTGSAPTKPAPQTKVTESNSLADSSLLKSSRTTVNMVAPPPRCTGGKKRPAWDTKGRLEDMEEAMAKHLQQNTSFQQQILSSNERIALLESMNTQLTGTIKEKEQQSSEASGEIHLLQRKLQENEYELESIRNSWKQQIQDLEFAKSSLERQKICLEGELAAAQEELRGLKMAVSQLSSVQASLESQLSAVKMNVAQSAAIIHDKDEEIALLKATIANHLQTISEANAKIRLDESIRRKLHNAILELKGNIRVFCRVRPLLDDETLGNNGEIAHLHFPDDDHKILELEKLADMNPNESVVALRKGTANKYEFTFDRVFAPSSSQADVFEEISQLVQSALDGYNVCMFAYGQTGSGKTYTMEGQGNSSAEHRGMIPRAVEQVFQNAVELAEKGWQYEFEVTFLEIYNETIRDLLSNNRDDVKHEIRLTGANGNEVYVTDLTVIKVTNQEQTFDVLGKAAHNRSVAQTKCNERSSRSHSIFRMKMIGKNCLTAETCCGLLNLIDLAGSERLKESGSQGQRLKETQNINKSLANLGNVIMALANKESHVPYRNSKLTHLLQNCLGGSSKTLMFVNVSPKEDCFQETLNSLRFATKVNECNIGTAQKKVK